MTSYRQMSERDGFFGRDNYKNHKKGFVSYKSILNDDVIILRTEHVVYRDVPTTPEEGPMMEYVLMVGNQQALLIPSFNLKHISYYKNDKLVRAELVKLDRRYFNPKFYPHETNKKIEFDGVDSFDSLYEQARLQGLEKTKVRL